MDILMTFMIVGIIGLSVLPFFLLSGVFGAKRQGGEAANDGPVVPVPMGKDGMPFHPSPSDSDDGDGEDTDGEDGDADDDGSLGGSN